MELGPEIGIYFTVSPMTYHCFTWKCRVLGEVSRCQIRHTWTALGAGSDTLVIYDTSDCQSVVSELNGGTLGDWKMK